MRRSEGATPSGVGALPSLQLKQCSLRCGEVGVSHSFTHSARPSFTNICCVPGPELALRMG